MKTIYNAYDGILSRLYKQEQNKKLNIRIKNVKSIVDSHCPNTFKIFKTKPNRSLNYEEQAKNFSIKRDNMKIFQKLSDIDKNPRSLYGLPSFKFRKNNRESLVKNGIKALAQENLFILKKLISQESVYKRDKFEQMFRESRNYKRNICHFPSINFYKTNTWKRPLIQSYDIQPKKHRIVKTEGNYPSINNPKNAKKFISLQTKYALINNKLNPCYFKEATKINKNNNTSKTFRKDKNEKESDTDVNNNQDKDDFGKIESEEEEENSDDKKKKSSEDGKESEEGSGSGSGSGSASGPNSGTSGNN